MILLCYLLCGNLRWVLAGWATKLVECRYTVDFRYLEHKENEFLAQNSGVFKIAVGLEINE